MVGGQILARFPKRLNRQRRQIHRATTMGTKKTAAPIRHMSTNVQKSTITSSPCELAFQHV